MPWKEHFKYERIRSFASLAPIPPAAFRAWIGCLSVVISFPSLEYAGITSLKTLAGLIHC